MLTAVRGATSLVSRIAATSPVSSCIRSCIHLPLSHSWLVVDVVAIRTRIHKLGKVFFEYGSLSYSMHVRILHFRLISSFSSYLTFLLALVAFMQIKTDRSKLGWSDHGKCNLMLLATIPSTFLDSCRCQARLVGVCLRLFGRNVGGVSHGLSSAWCTFGIQCMVACVRSNLFQVFGFCSFLSI